MTQVQFNYDLATCQQIARGLWDRYTKGTKSQLDRSDVAGMLQEAYKTINKNYNPSEEDVKGYEKVLDRDNDGRMTYQDLERAVIETLGSKNIGNEVTVQMDEPAERTKKSGKPKAVQSKPPEPEEDPLYGLAKRLFTKYAGDLKGTLGPDEIPKILEDTWKVMGLNKQATKYDVESYLRMVDNDSDGKIYFEEFFGAMRKTAGGLSSLTRSGSGSPSQKSKSLHEIIIEAFKKFDSDGSGYIEDNEIPALLQDLYNTLGMNRTITLEDAKFYINKLDTNMDGKISLEEFEPLFINKEAK